MTDSLAALLARLTSAIEHATSLRADLDALGDDLAAVLPSLAEDGPAARSVVAGFFGIDESTPAGLRRIAERLSEVLALLRANDSQEAWLRGQLAALGLNTERVDSARFPSFRSILVSLCAGLNRRGVANERVVR